MMIHMTYLASVYAIGVLIIDEMQHLMIKAKHSPDEMLNFFLTLVNCNCQSKSEPPIKTI
jgi:hypothetical protein